MVHALAKGPPSRSRDSPAGSQLSRRGWIQLLGPGYPPARNKVAESTAVSMHVDAVLATRPRPDRSRCLWFGACPVDDQIRECLPR